MAGFRSDAGRDLAQPDYQQLITELVEGSADFAAMWARQDVRGRQEGLKRLQHPTLGRLDLEFTIFHVAEQPTLRLYLYTPADEATRERHRATGSDTLTDTFTQTLADTGSTPCAIPLQ